MEVIQIIVGIGIALVFYNAGVTYATDCPDGFVSHQSICYKEFGIRASWEEANIYCEAYGAEPATVVNQIEQIFLSGYLQRLTQGYFNSGIFWLGGSDGATEGNWLWNKTGNVLSYTNWKTGEPNNAATFKLFNNKTMATTYIGRGEDCLTMTFKDNFSWNDNNCDYKFNFVCEIRRTSYLAISPEKYRK